MNNNIPEIINTYGNEANIKPPAGQKADHKEPPKGHHEQLDIPTGKAVGKGVVTEHLRTELKSIENRHPAAPAPAADNRAIMTRNPLYM